MWRQKCRLEFQFARGPNVEKFTHSISKIILLSTVTFIFLHSLKGLVAWTLLDTPNLQQ